MPGGLGNPAALLAFPAVKFIGYTAFAVYLNSAFAPTRRNPLYVGGARMLLGLVFGTALAIFSFPFVFVGGLGILIYVVGLVPVRILEWYIIIKVFYGVDGTQAPDIRKVLLLGVVWSFILDIPAIIGFVSADGFWIC